MSLPVWAGYEVKPNNDMISPKFYTSGTVTDYSLYDLFGKLLRTFIQGSDDIEVGSPCEIYQIAASVSERARVI